MMKAKWPIFKLVDVCEQITDGKHGDCENQLGSGFYFLSAKDIRDGRLAYEDARQIAEIDFIETHKRTRLEPLDILFTNSGTIGRMALAPADERTLRTTFQKSVAILKPKQSVIEPRFLYYTLLAENRRLSDFAGGTAQKNLLLKDLRAFAIKLPPLATQEKIASTLSAYDDLTENNSRRIKILEEMANMIYREWFVKFRIPGHEKRPLSESECGTIPEGWSQPYPNYVDFLEGPGLRRWQYRDSGLRFLNIRTIADGDIDLSKTQFVDPLEAEAKYKHFLLSEFDHVVSSSGTIGRIVTVRREHLPLMLNTSVIRMRPKTDSVGRWQLKHFLKSDYFQTQIKSFASGVAQMNFGPSHLKLMKIIAPPEDIGRDYESLVSPMEELICTLTAKNVVLRNTRDLLLPKLVSGQVCVERFEVEPAAQVS